MPLPDLMEVLGDFTVLIQFRIMGKGTDDFEVVEKMNDPITFRGVLAPLTAQQLSIKPEGQRSWRWWNLYTKRDLTLDWIITDMDNVKFRVMNRRHWGSFLEYELRENPTL